MKNLQSGFGINIGRMISERWGHRWCPANSGRFSKQLNGSNSAKDAEIAP